MSTYLLIPINSNDNKVDSMHQYRIIENLTVFNGIDSTNTLNESLLNDLPKICTQNEIEQPTIQAKPESKTYKCPKCNENFMKLSTFRKHTKTHQIVKPFKCDKCNDTFNVETNLKIHSVVHSEGKPICPICHLTFQRFASLKSHLILHQVEEYYTCEECGKEFENIESLMKHTEIHAQSNTTDMLKCGYCDISFSNTRKYKEHLSYHVKVNKMIVTQKKIKKGINKKLSHICMICQKGFTKLSLLERHQRIHSGEKPYSCEFCGKNFNQKGSLDFHLRKHKGIKPYECTLCHAKFGQKGNLRAHVERTHTLPSPHVETFKCTLCACMFKKLASLNAHMTKSHSNLKDLDDLRTTSNNQPKELELEQTIIRTDMQMIDQKIHERNKNILDGMNYDNCMPTISYVKLSDGCKDPLKKYMINLKIVDGVKCYICNYCQKEFKKPSDLIRHLRVHTKERPFNCTKCDSSFSLKSSLYYHLGTHKKSSKCVCEFCMKEFTSMKSLNIHLKLHQDKSTKDLNKMNETISLKQLLSKTDDDCPASNELTQPTTSDKDSDSHESHKCQICNLQFGKITYLNKHMLLHNDNKKLKCHRCPKLYTTKSALKKHSTIHAGVKDYSCKICHKKFFNQNLLRKHSITHEEDVNRFKCPHCAQIFENMMIYAKHMELHLDDNLSQLQTLTNTEKLDSINDKEVIENGICNNFLPQNITTDMKTDQLQILINYENTPDLSLSTEKTIPTDYPLDDLDTFDPITTPIDTDNNLIALTEVEIDKETNRNNTIVDNVLLENIQFTTADAVTNDQLIILPNDLQQFATDTIILDATNETMKNVNQNLLFGLTPQDFVNDNLTSNELICTYSCKKCQKTFTEKDMYDKHLSNHEKNRNYECIFCCKGFKKLSDLNRHLRIHTGEKPFECEQCGRRFTLKSTLESHYRTHNSSRPKTDLKKIPNTLKGNDGNQITFLDATKPVDTDEYTKTASHQLIQIDPVILQEFQTDNVIFETHPIYPTEIVHNNLIDMQIDTNNQISNMLKPKNFECSICFKKYASKDVLRKHKKRHGINKNYPCNKCDKGYDLLDDLNAHLVTHFGERPFSCYLCHNSFAKKNYLNTHLKRFHQVTENLSQ